MESTRAKAPVKPKTGQYLSGIDIDAVQVMRLFGGRAVTYFARIPRWKNSRCSRPKRVGENSRFSF
jgi:hypothetical protein